MVPVVRPLSRAFGTDETEDAKAVVGMGAGLLSEFLTDTFIEPGLFNKIIKFLMGTGLKAVAGKLLHGDDKEDVELWGNYVLSRVFDPSPRQMAELARETADMFARLKEAAELGDWGKVRRALGIKTLDQIRGEFEEVVNALKSMAKGMKSAFFRGSAPSAPPVEEEEFGGAEEISVMTEGAPSGERPLDVMV